MIIDNKLGEILQSPALRVKLCLQLIGAASKRTGFLSRDDLKSQSWSPHLAIPRPNLLTLDTKFTVDLS